jgi:YegS/Rv2252/BmrU family lipid kinase
VKTRFIYNPCSGKNRRRPWLAAAIRAFIAKHELDAALVCTGAPRHATALAEAAIAEGCERIVAVGGDGTMNEVAQALIHAPAALALVPCGSGNGLALHLGIPTSPRRALALLADATSRVTAIDTGSANGHPFCNAMGLGFDAEISRRFNQLVRRGLPAYALTGYRALKDHAPEHCVIHGEGRHEQFAMSVIAIANSDQYGNRAYIAPGAKVDDGALDLVAVPPVTFLTALPLAARLFLGTFDRSPSVLRLRDRRFLIERPAPGLIHTDGETHDTTSMIEVLVHPKSLRIVVPNGCYTRNEAPDRASAPAEDRLQTARTPGPALHAFLP